MDSPISEQPHRQLVTDLTIYTSLILSEPLESGQPLYNGQNLCSQLVHCRAVPLYTACMLKLISANAVLYYGNHPMKHACGQYLKGKHSPNIYACGPKIPGTMIVMSNPCTPKI